MQGTSESHETLPTSSVALIAKYHHTPWDSPVILTVSWTPGPGFDGVGGFATGVARYQVPSVIGVVE